jgi:hypothetical protein
MCVEHMRSDDTAPVQGRVGRCRELRGRAVTQSAGLVHEILGWFHRRSPSLKTRVRSTSWTRDTSGEPLRYTEGDATATRWTPLCSPLHTVCPE